MAGELSDDVDEFDDEGEELVEHKVGAEEGGCTSPLLLDEEDPGATGGELLDWPFDETAAAATAA